SSPQPNATQSLTTNLISNTRAYTGAFKDGFLSGGNMTASYSDNYLRENAPTDLVNPSVAPRLSLSMQHNLLNGFGVATDARNIPVSKISIDTGNQNFRNTVATVTAQVLNAYYALAANYRSLEAAQKSLEVAKAFEDYVQKQIDNGAASNADLI